MSKRLLFTAPRTKAFLSYFDMLRRVRSGSKISRVLRHIFEQKKLKTLLGSNIALAIIASSLLPTASLTQAADSAEQSVINPPQKVSLSTERSIAFPVKKVIITQGFSIFHPGLDLDGITGDPINPIMDGTVSDVQFSRFAYGNAVFIDHGNGISSLYAHLSKIFVKKGQTVNTLTKIGEMGSTGHATGDHLHLEVRENGFPINPLSILPPL